MKKNTKIFLIGTMLLLFNVVIAQDYTAFELNIISKDLAWSSVTKTFKKLKLPNIYLTHKVVNVNSDYYNYTNLLSKNRLRFKVGYQNEKLTISIFGRQYLSGNSWVKNPLPMSKGQAAKILNPIKEQVIVFIKENNTAETNQRTEKEQETKITNPPEKLDIAEDYIRINSPDPALGIATVNPKIATIDLDYWESVSGVVKNGENNGKVLLEELTLELQDNNIRFVSRSLLDKILGELNLGSSELADPVSSPKLGKLVLAGFYIISKCTSNTDKATFNYRVVYTETGEIVYANTISHNKNLSVNELLQIAKTESERIVAVIETFAKKRVLIVKENPKRYSE